MGSESNPCVVQPVIDKKAVKLPLFIVDVMEGKSADVFRCLAVASKVATVGLN